MKEGWCTVSKCISIGNTPVHRLKGPEGLRLTLVEVEGPLVSAYIALSTEAHDDDGLPHTLEHLVFLGSEDYPYKGLLDLFANRCYASGTNAWTDTDHTAYTLNTAGSKGMLKMLPIYLDHILYPVLTDYAYLTEVYHIDGEGKDAGVVYSEMQGRENNSESRCIRKILLAAYPDSGYSSETGGLMENLRISTNNQKVRNYHKTFYRPENVVIILVGQIDCDDVLEALEPIVEKIGLKRREQRVEPFIRPWQSPVPPIKSTEIIKEKYPTDSEDTGLIMVGWRGPNILISRGYYEFTACCILLRYLCDTPIAPFQKTLVEIENPYASDVTMGVFENSAPLFTISLENVPLKRLDEALPELRKCIDRIASQPNSINLERIKMVICKQLRECFRLMEDRPHDTFGYACLVDVLYELSNEQFEEMLNKQKMLKSFLNEDEDFWLTLFKQYFHVDFVSVIGSPSKELMIQLFEDENQRHEQNKKTLGADGLKLKLNELNAAMEYNSREPPSNIFDAVGDVDCDDMKLFSLEMWSSDNESCPYFPIHELPFYARVHHINSQFAYITLLINTCGLTEEQRFYIPLFIELLPQLPYVCDNVYKEHSALIEEIESLTNKLSFNIGIESRRRFYIGEFQQTISFYTQCEPEKYAQVVKLIWCILKKTTFTKSRMLIVAQKMYNDISRIRRQGQKVATDFLDDLILTKRSNFYHCCMMRQQKFLNEIITKLEKQDDDYLDILSNLEKLRQDLFTNNNIWLHFAANLKSYSYTSDPWKLYPIIDAPSLDSPQNILPGAITEDCSYLKNRKQVAGHCCIVGVGGLESSFVKQYSPGPPTLSHPDIPALYVIAQYFTQLEGPMWRNIRGAGLSYEYALNIKPTKGMIEFRLFKATNGAQAYIKTKHMINSFLENINWDENLFVSAKSSLVYDLVAKEAFPAKLISRSLTNYYEKVDLNFNAELIKKVSNITKEEISEVAKRWLPNLFDSKCVTLVVVCNSSKVKDSKAAFEKFGFEDPRIYNSVEEINSEFE